MKRANKSRQLFTALFLAPILAGCVTLEGYDEERVAQTYRLAFDGEPQTGQTELGVLLTRTNHYQGWALYSNEVRKPAPEKDRQEKEYVAGAEIVLEASSAKYSSEHPATTNADGRAAFDFRKIVKGVFESMSMEPLTLRAVAPGLDCQPAVVTITQRRVEELYDAIE